MGCEEDPDHLNSEHQLKNKIVSRFVISTLSHPLFFARTLIEVSFIFEIDFKLKIDSFFTIFQYLFFHRKRCNIFAGLTTGWKIKSLRLTGYGKFSYWLLLRLSKLIMAFKIFV